MNARDLGGNGVECAANFVRHILLRIPEIQMRWTALQINHDDTFGLAPPRPTAGRAGRGSTCVQR